MSTRNTEAHFANLPGINIGRSKFDMSFTHKTTLNSADLVPIYVNPDIIPGDTVNMKMSEIIRMTTPIAPVMDNAFIDVYFFFVPDRLVWKNFKRFMGENETAPWTQLGDYQVPQIEMDDWTQSGDNLVAINEKGSVLDHMGIPILNWTKGEGKTKSIKFSQLPTRAYCLIWNEFFRDENLQNPVNVPTDDTDVVMFNTKGSSYQSDPDAAQVSYAYRGGYPPLKVCKPFDYFTGCLPGAQKGPAVTIPLSDDLLPVRIGKTYDMSGETAAWVDTKSSGNVNLTGRAAGIGVTMKGFDHDPYETQTSAPISVPQTQDVAALYTDLSDVTGATINQLRQAFAIQKFYERDARGGTRYIESVFAHFGVRNPDYRLQRPEYLGGFRHYINMNQVVQSTPTVDESTPLGTTGAYSVTSNKNNGVFTKSFTEHGILMGLCCIRTNHTYQQGINRSWFKKKRLDFYTPEFANLGEMAVLNKEIYMQGTSADEEAFGYQEAWAEMRHMPDIVSGEMRSNYAQSLDIWHYADYYTEKPTLGDKWIQETPSNIERTLAIQSHDQFIADFYFGATYTRPLPLYSIPGLIDHH